MTRSDYQMKVLLYIFHSHVNCNSPFTVHFKLKELFVNNKFRIAIPYRSQTVKKSRFVLWHWQRKYSSKININLNVWSNNDYHGTSLVVNPIFLVVLVSVTSITLEILVVNIRNDG